MYLDDASGSNAIGADDHFLNPAAGKGTHSLQVWIKSTLGHIMCMADMMSDHWFFAADFTRF